MKEKKDINGIAYAVHSKTGEIIEIDSFNNKFKGFILCPYCLKPISFKKGNIRKPHFFHLNLECSGNKVGSLGESESHKKGKEIMLDYIKNIFDLNDDLELFKLESEFYIKDEKLEIERIADIYCEFLYKGKIFKKVIEIQYSDIPEEELIQRHIDYNKLGIEDIWIVGYQLGEKIFDIDTETRTIFDYVGNLDIKNNFKDYLRSNIDINIHDHNWLQKYLFIPSKYRKIKNKVLALCNKISSFQKNIYLIDNNNIRIFSDLSVEFNGNSIDRNKFNNLVNKDYIYDIFEKRTYCINFQNITNLKKIKFDYHSIILYKEDITIEFLINGSLKLYSINKYELSLKEKELIRYNRRLIKFLELEKKNLEEQKKAYYLLLTNKDKGIENFYYLLFKLILSFQHIITHYKNSYRDNKSFSQLNDMMINHNINTRLKGKYGFFSGFNKVYISIIKRGSRDIFYPKELLNNISELILFIEKVEFDLYDKISFNGFLEYFNDIKNRIEYEEGEYEILDEGKTVFFKAEIYKDLIFGLFEIVNRLSYESSDNYKNKLEFIYKSIVGTNIKKSIASLNREHEEIVNIWENRYKYM